MGNMPTCDIAIIIVCAGRHGTTERRAGAPGMNTSMKSEFQEERKPNLQKYENQTSGSMEIELQEVRKPNLQKYECELTSVKQ